MIAERVDFDMSPIDGFNFFSQMPGLYTEAFFQEQTIDELIRLQSQSPDSDSVLPYETIIYKDDTTVMIYPKIMKFDVNPNSAPRIYNDTKVPDYSELFSITTLYWSDVQQSMDRIAEMPCMCPHDTSSQTSFSPSGEIFSFNTTLEDHHDDHCEKCGECLVDGKCPKCGCAH
jgi:hypothetical protein